MATVPFPEVKDRNVATPSRVRLTKAVGIEDDEVFDVEPVPGTVYDEGTPLNKEFFDALKRYIDASSGAGEILGIAYGGTGADNAADARTNLDVYSKGEVDEELDRTAGLIEPHITRRVTDSTDGVHGFYIDQDYTMWIDPDGDGVYEEMPSTLSFPNGTSVILDCGSFRKPHNEVWCDFYFPMKIQSDAKLRVLAWTDDFSSSKVLVNNVDSTHFSYSVIKNSIKLNLEYTDGYVSDVEASIEAAYNSNTCNIYYIVYAEYGGIE